MCRSILPGIVTIDLGNLLMRGVYRMFNASHYVHNSWVPESRLGREMLGSGPPVISIWRLSKLKFVVGRTLNTKGGDPQKRDRACGNLTIWTCAILWVPRCVRGAEVRLGETDPETYPKQARTPRVICH